MFLATRYKLSSLAPDILAFDDQPWVEQIVIYIGVTVVRLLIYFIHRIGNFGSWSHAASTYKSAILFIVLILCHLEFASDCYVAVCIVHTRHAFCRDQQICLAFTGIFYFLSKAGAVSALPAHLMSDHVFLGSALVALLSAEAVFFARDIR